MIIEVHFRNVDVDRIDFWRSELDRVSQAYTHISKTLRDGVGLLVPPSGMRETTAKERVLEGFDGIEDLKVAQHVMENTRSIYNGYASQLEIAFKSYVQKLMTAHEVGYCFLACYSAWYRLGFRSALLPCVATYPEEHFTKNFCTYCLSGLLILGWDGWKCGGVDENQPASAEGYV